MTCRQQLIPAFDWQRLSGDAETQSFPTRRKFTASSDHLIRKNIPSVVSGAESLYSFIKLLLNWLVFSLTHLFCSFYFEIKDMRLTDTGENYTDSPWKHLNWLCLIWIDPSTSSGLKFLCCKPDFWLLTPVLLSQRLEGKTLIQFS